jgi:hypothetical protein
MGVAVGVMVYALARHRFGAPRWIAALATLPVLFDGFQIQLEHLILSDVPFEFLIALAVTLLLWDRKPSWQRCTLIGFILGIAETVRSVALPLLPVFALYIILVRIGWRALVGGLVACLAPVLLYCTWFYSVYGQFAMTESTGVFLYSRTMAFAECSKMHVPANELSLCITTPPDKRPMSQQYVWAAYSPLNRFPPSKFSPLPNQLAEDFAKRAILAQPLGYAQIVAYDTIRVFEWRRYVFPNAATYNEYLFGYKSLGIPSWARGHVGSYDSDVAYYIRGNPLTDVVEPFAGVMRVWQRWIWHGLRRDPGRGPGRHGAELAACGRPGHGALADLGGTDHGAGRDRGVRLQVRAARGAVRLPGRGHGVRQGHHHGQLGDGQARGPAGAQGRCRGPGGRG